MTRKLLLFLIAVVVLYGGYVAVSLLMLPGVETAADRKQSFTIQVRDWKGKLRPFVLGPKNRYWTPSRAIPPEMKWAVVLAEDANFYTHEGIDVKAIKEAIKYDLEKKSFARGASTITQQLAKNLFLSREKSLTRKIKEVILAKRMERELTKGRIMELYLNVVELGPMVYGIGHGAQYYFGKPASALTPRECAFLAAMLPGPRVVYNPYRNMGKVLKRSNMILDLLRGKRVLSEDEYRMAMAEEPNVSGLQRKVETTIRKEETVLAPTSSARVVPMPAQQAPEETSPVEEKSPGQTAAPPPEQESGSENK